MTTAAERTQRIPIPEHKILRVGTLSAILRLVANHKGVSRDTILATLFRWWVKANFSRSARFASSSP